MEIPYNRLDPELLQAVIEEFVTREGTEYGSSEYPLESKIRQVFEQLKNGHAKLYFDEVTDTCHIVPTTSQEKSS